MSAIAKLTESLNKCNWTVWKERMKRVMCMCGVNKYVIGTIPRPANTVNGEAWDYNNNYTQVIIMSILQNGTCEPR
jgi:hypothetical protein